MIDNEKYVKVVVNPLEPAKKTGAVNNTDIVITQNGVYEPEPPYTGFGKVDVSVTTAGAVIEPLSITPTTSAQEIEAPTGVDGYNPISVGAVTSSIDSNIQAGNIKSGVSILGVSGNVTELQGETRTVSITSSLGNTFTPSAGKNGITSITAVPALQTTSVSATTYQYSLVPSSNKCGFSEITVRAVTASIDSDIQPENIKSGVSILGVAGTLSTTKYNATVSCFLGDIDANGVLQRPSEVTNLSFDGVKNIGTGGVEKGALYYRFRNLVNIGTVSFPDLEDVGTTYCMSGAFRGSSITSVSFAKLTQTAGSAAMYYAFAESSISNISFPVLQTVNGSQSMAMAFLQCTGLTSVSFPSLTTVSGYLGMYECFYGCTNLSSISLPVLKTISGNSGMQSVFAGCRALTTATFDVLDSMDNTSTLFSAFNGCTSLQHIYFPALKSTSFGSYNDQFTNLVWGVDGCTIHFPSNLDPQTGSTVISSLNQYPLFRGTNTVLLFDLPATE